MKDSLVMMLLAGAVLLSGCAHIAATKATFTQTGGVLALQIDRHMEELMHAPDLEEDQTLVLELRDYQIGERLAVPSAKAQARLEVQRFGPTSYGREFTGWVMVRKVTAAKIVADVKLVVTARTITGNYVQIEKFNDQYQFIRPTASGDGFDGVFTSAPNH